MGRYDADANAWSGLLSGDKYEWQRGLRDIAQQTGDFMFHSSMSGYEGWNQVADSIAMRRPKSVFLTGHSNGVFAITSIAKAVKPLGIDCWLCSFDRTMKPCPMIGGNVSQAIDIWAGLKTLTLAPDFHGQYRRYDFNGGDPRFPNETHLGIINNKQAIDIAVAFARKWKASKA